MRKTRFPLEKPRKQTFQEKTTLPGTDRQIDRERERDGGSIAVPSTVVASVFCNDEDLLSLSTDHLMQPLLWLFAELDKKPNRYYGMASTAAAQSQHAALCDTLAQHLTVSVYDPPQNHRHGVRVPRDRHAQIRKRLGARDGSALSTGRRPS